MSPEDIILIWSATDGANRTITFEDFTAGISGGGDGTPGGSPTQLQFNNAGAFGGISKAVWNGSQLTLTDVALTGTPIAPTAANGTNTTQIATTAFVLANTSTGNNAYSTTAFDFTVPSLLSSVSITLQSAAWVTVGVNIFVETSGTYLVTAKVGNALTAQLISTTGVTGVVTAGKLVQASGPVGPTGPTGPSSTVPGPTGPTGAGLNGTYFEGFATSYPAGYGHIVNTTPTAIAVNGGTPQKVVLTSAGRYLIIATYTIEWASSATSTAATAVLSEVTRVNNSAAVLTNATDSAVCQPVTSFEGIFAKKTITAIYNTANTDDDIEVYVYYQGSGPDTAGAIVVRQLHIVAVKISS